ncbi:MAG TPA: DUF192 domain-containing protein [Actinomycetota bacterium]
MRTITAVDPRGAKWRLSLPETRRERMRGLIGASEPERRSALFIERARSVHTFGMRFAIAVVLLGADHRVIRVLRVPPRRLVLPRPGVRHVLECAVHTDVREGDRLRLGEEISR